MFIEILMVIQKQLCSKIRSFRTTDANSPLIQLQWEDNTFGMCALFN